MPRRRKYSRLTKREIESLGSLIAATPIIIVISFLVYLIFSFTNWLNNALGVSSEFTSRFALLASITVITGIPIAIIIVRNKGIERKYRGINIANVDDMDGIEFEIYLQKLLTNKGYVVNMTSASGDLGVDLVAIKDAGKIAIQAKRFNSNVSRRAISDAVAGMHHYGCNQAMVITNSYFSPGAITLAQSTNCILVDRDTLAEWINEFQNTNPQIVQQPRNAQ